MNEATTKALTDIVYGAFGEAPDVHGLDNEQIYNLARTAAETIEAAGTTKAIIRAWLEEIGLWADALERMSEICFLSIYQHGRGPDSMAAYCQKWGKAVREVTGE